MVLVNCHAVYDRYLYKEISVMLKERDITMHYLSPFTFRLKNRVMENLFGFNQDYHVFNDRHLRSRIGDSTLRNHLKKPKDYLTALAIQSGGVVFSQAFLGNGTDPTAMLAGSILGTQIAVTGVPTSCQVLLQYICVLNLLVSDVEL